MTNEERMELREALAQLEYFWRYENRVQLLKEAGMTCLLPHLNLEGSPREVAIRVANIMQDHNDPKQLNDLTIAMYRHPNT